MNNTTSRRQDATRYLGKTVCSKCHKRMRLKDLQRHLQEEHPARERPKLEDAPHTGYRDSKVR